MARGFPSRGVLTLILWSAETHICVQVKGSLLSDFDQNWNVKILVKLSNTKFHETAVL
jgi:hypothetical protein